MAFLSTSLKCLYSNAHSMRKNRRNWKCVCSYRATTSLGSQRHSGLAHTTGVLQQMHPGPLGRAGQDGDGELPFLAREHPECTEFCLGTGDDPVKSSWVRIIEQTNTRVCHRPPDQEDVDEALFRQLAEASHLVALVLMGDLNHPDISKDNSRAEEI